jgi:uncharacterized protein involved in exopolysaccharide biosynthesis/Mrp family chromosome partitioning ATPase
MNDQGTEVPSISLLDVLRGVGQRKLLISAITVMAFGLGVFYVKSATPVYSTESQLIIENLASPYDRVQNQDNQTPDQIDDRTIQSQISVLKSNDLALRVIADLQLQEKPEFNPLKLKDLGTVSQLLIQLGFGEDPRLMTVQERALKRYLDKLNVYQVPESNVIAVKYTAADPKVAADVANTLAKAYVAETAETRSQPTNRAREWLARQIEALRTKVATSDAEIERFRAQAGLLKGATSTLGTQELSELNSQITLADTTRSEAQARATAIKTMLDTKGTVDDSVDVLNSPSMQRLREQQAASARRVAELSATYLSNHPRMIAARNDLRNIDVQIRAEATRIADGLVEQAKIATARQNALVAKLNDLKSKETSANLDDVKLKALERESTADKALLESLLLRYADASARQDVTTQPGMARVIQQATVPTTPSFPRVGPTVMLITLAGLALALGLSFLMEIMAAASRLSQRLAWREEPEAEDSEEEPVRAALPPASSPSPAETRTPPPPARPAAAPTAKPVPLMTPLASIHLPNALSADAERVAALQSARSPGLTDSLHRLTDWVEEERLRGLKRIGVVSLGGQPSDTACIAITIARAMAPYVAKVVAVDLAAAAPRLDAVSGLGPTVGISELLAGKVDFTKVIQRDPASTVHVLGYGAENSAAVTTAVQQRAGAILQTLERLYGLVLVSGGETGPDSAAVFAGCDAIVVLASPQRIPELAALMQRIAAAGIHAVHWAKLDHRPEASDHLVASA